jgi:hypothetical protein
MGRKIFISYNYADGDVKPIGFNWFSTARHYVDKIQEMIGEEHINKGEDDGEDMSSLADATIQSKLGDKIYDSSVTIVLISPNMKDNSLPENEQWIPWEISYSLREQSRGGRQSKTNAMLAVVLPDSNGRYDYFIEEHTCPYCNSTTYKTNTLFKILSKNMFNRYNPTYSSCQHHGTNRPQTGYTSYIYVVKWDAFVLNHDYYIDIACAIKDRISEYKITKTLE